MVPSAGDHAEVSVERQHASAVALRTRHDRRIHRTERKVGVPVCG